MINAAWALGAPNVKYLGTIYVSPGTIDFGPIATKIKSLNPDVADLIYEGYNQGSVPQIYRALYDVGFKGTILPGLMSQADLTAIVVQTGKAAVEGGMQSSMGLDPRTFQTDPRMLSLCDAYVKAYGQMQTDGLTETGGFLLLEAAINATQSVDVDVIKHYLDNSPPPIQVMMGFSRLVARPDNSDYLTNVIVSSGPAGLIHDGKVMAGSLQTCKDNYLSTIIMMKLQDAYKAYWLKYGYPVWPASQKGLETFHYTDLGITGQD
jgi:ABC-type branched-subunit amino acid transport system substrate-binding protein